jgi:DNA polymerase bacteriophage-type
MPTIYWDVETYSDRSLTEHGADLYAKHPSTRPLGLCFAVDDGEVQIWMPDDPPAAIFLAAADNPDPNIWRFVSDNWTFENAILEHVLIPRHGFRPLPLEIQDCAQRLALANAYPAELGLRCEALGLPYGKNPEARKAMLRIARPKTAKHQRKVTNTEQYQHDLMLTMERCKTDVQATRACYNAPQLRHLAPTERELLLIDARINARGVRCNVPFLTAACELTVRERNAINARLNELTCGAITSVDQVARIMQAVNARGHHLSSLAKRSVAAALAHRPDNYVQELLTLRQQGAYASVRKFKTLLNFADPEDQRVRDSLRIYGGAPGRWSGLKPQLQNLKRNDAELPAFLVDDITAGNRDALARFGNPLTSMGELSRAALCAAPDHVLICADFGAIESRILSWLAGEQWKLDAYAAFDRSGDKNLDVYRVVAHRMLHKTTPVSAITTAERQLGKCAELAFGFGGALGAWRKISQHDPRTDQEINAIVRQWRNTHPAVTRFWKELARAIRVSIRTGQPVLVLPAPRPSIVVHFANATLTLQLPSERAITYPQARLVPNRKFEDGDPDIEFMDNARGQWKPVRAWFGTFVENVVQGTARDLLAAALIRFERHGWPVVFHNHDEITVEIPNGSVSEQDMLALFLEPPAWATRLPLGGKVRSGTTYLEAPATAQAPEPETDAEIVEAAVDAFVADIDVMPPSDAAPADRKAFEQGVEQDFLASLGETFAPLTELVSLPMDASGHVSCPFHDDPNPSCSIYADHYFCHACRVRGDRIDWLTKVEGVTRAEAMAALYDWSAGSSSDAHAALQQSAEEKYAYVMRLWTEARPLIGSPAELYLRDTRNIDTPRLPASIHDTLRFHPRCPFGARVYRPCLIALMRDPRTNAPVGIHRIGLTVQNGAVIKLDRKALGRMGVVKLWPLNGDRQLVVGEGIETTLAAATRVSYRGAPLTPAWSAVARGGLGQLPVLPEVDRLILLVDHDANGEGQRAAEICRRVWTSAGRLTVPLTPKQRGWDFNDLVLGRKA